VINSYANACDLDAPVGESLEGNYFVSTYPPFSCWSQTAEPAYRATLATEPVSPPPLGLYVHVPFCVKRCDYCYYRSYAQCSDLDKNRYIEAVLSEAEFYQHEPMLSNRRAAFVYFGGGTPSLLTDRQIAQLLGGLQRLLPWDVSAEVTFECAPKSVTRNKLRLLRELGVTRLSLGVQQFDDTVLAANSRVHLVEDVERAYELVREAGFAIVNLDLIVGLVAETDRTFYHSVRRAIELAADSVTIYQLEIPRNTNLFRRLHELDQVPPILPAGWGTKRRRLATGFCMLDAAGYTLRSAYAAVRDPARMSFVYQDAQYRGADLLGLGLASFSYLDGLHFQNVSRLDEYVERLARGELPFARGYALDQEEQMVREFVLQLKLGQVERGYFRQKFGVDIADQMQAILSSFAERGWLQTDDASIRLTRAGLLRADRLLPAFYLPMHQGIPYA
jgi:oxygen-independent coproporphyrinogen-3 oxidase